MARSTDAQKSERLNAAHCLLACGTGVQEALVSLSHQFGLSRRQAYRYLQEAETIGHPVPVVAPSVPITLKIPANIVGEVRTLFGDQRLDSQRDRPSGDHGFSDRRTRAWLTGDRVGIGIKSSSITHLIVCLVANFSKSTSGWFPIRCGLPARV